jgi:hypothetical protein
MAQKVYWKGLELGASSLHRYISRYQQQLSVSLTGPQYACVTDLLAALASCLAILPRNTPEV